MTIGELIKKYCYEHNISGRKFGEQCGITSGYVSMIINGRNSQTGRPPIISIEKYQRIADAMGMSLDELFNTIDNAPIKLPRKSELNIINFKDIQHHKIPLIGSVAGGEPIYDEEVDLWLDGPIKAQCAVKLNGQSMEPIYKDGDIIYIREQPNVDDGTIAVVILDDEACLKRVYHIDNGLQLCSENPKYKPIIATFEEYNSIRILGIPCGYTRIYGNGTMDVVS